MVAKRMVVQGLPIVIKDDESTTLVELYVDRRLEGVFDTPTSAIEYVKNDLLEKQGSASQRARVEAEGRRRR